LEKLYDGAALHGERANQQVARLDSALWRITRRKHRRRLDRLLDVCRQRWHDLNRLQILWNADLTRCDQLRSNRAGDLFRDVRRIQIGAVQARRKVLWQNAGALKHVHGRPVSLLVKADEQVLHMHGVSITALAKGVRNRQRAPR
jgi:hypothetical protein